MKSLRKPLKFHFIVAVWGTEYTDMFLDIVLPNHITEGNLKAFADEDALLKIFTHADDEQRITQSPMIKELIKIMPVEIRNIENLVISPKHQRQNKYNEILSSMTLCHKIAASEANCEEAVQVYLAPDTVMTEGSLGRMRELAYQGKRIVAIPQIRVVKESFVPAFTAMFQNDDGFMPAPARSLTDLALSNIHPLTRIYFHDSDNFSPHFWYLAWKVGDKGVLMRCTGFHPLMINPSNKKALPISTIDLDYTFNAVPDYNNYHIVTDSDEIMGYEFSPKNKLSDLIKAGTFNKLTYARDIVCLHTEKNRRKILRKKIRIHADEIGEEWVEAERKSDEIINSSLALVDLIDSRFDMPRYLSANERRIVVFGASGLGRAWLGFARQAHLQVAHLVDSDKARWGDIVDGYTVENPDCLATRDYDLIIVAAGNDMSVISSRLNEMGLVRQKDFIGFNDQLSIGQISGARKTARLSGQSRILSGKMVLVEATFSGAATLNGQLQDIFSTGISITISHSRQSSVFIGETAVIMLQPLHDKGGVITVEGSLIKIESAHDRNDNQSVIFTFQCETIDEPTLTPYQNAIYIPF